MLERFLIVAVTDFKQKVRTARESGIESWETRALPRQFARLTRASSLTYNSSGKTSLDRRRLTGGSALAPLARHPDFICMLHHLSSWSPPAPDFRSFYYSGSARMTKNR